MTEQQIPKNEYETVEGTESQPYAAHEPRTIVHQRINSEHDTINMMSEIGDGTFVAWSNCQRCRQRVPNCTCPDGPAEPDHIARWRANRFERSLTQRPEPEFALLPSLLQWVRERGYAVVDPNTLAGVISAAQEAQDAAYGDSNDSEIGLLRDALEAALGALGLDLPEGKDPDEEDDEEEGGTEDTPDYETPGERREIAEWKASGAFERPPGNVHVIPDDVDFPTDTGQRPTRVVDDIEIDF